MIEAQDIGETQLTEPLRSPTYIPLPKGIYAYDSEYTWNDTTEQIHAPDPEMFTNPYDEPGQKFVETNFYGQPDIFRTLQHARTVLYSHIAAPPRLAVFAHKFAQQAITGLDINEEIIVRNEYNIRHHGLNNVLNLLHAPAEAIPVDNEQFDVVVTFEAIFQVPNLAFFEYMRVLHIGGTLLTSAHDQKTNPKGFFSHDVTLYPSICAKLYGFPIVLYSQGILDGYDGDDYELTCATVSVTKTQDAYKRLHDDMNILTAVLTLANPERYAIGDKFYRETQKMPHVSQREIFSVLQQYSPPRIAEGLLRLSTMSKSMFRQKTLNGFYLNAVPVILE